jgi:hypothetical protein
MIPKSALTAKQIDQLKNGQEDFIKQLAKDESRDVSLLFPWSIEETEHSIKGFVSMDNFDIADFMHHIGVDMDEVLFEGGY